tara:strand:- start:172 stop:429 length:258 start_codon:yes stop_codon:yes gene_type:complete|eukprot:scaffold62466_cov65-Phaeocystis_antarctica.AAC.2
MSGRPSKNFRWQQACMWLFLHLQSERHGGGSLDTQMKHSGGSSVGKVNTSCNGTTQAVISAGGAVTPNELTFRERDTLWTCRASL